jgi:hypothetical protein
LFSAPALQTAQGRSDAEQWRSVTSAEREDVPGVPLLLAAYALFAICVTSYIVRLVRLERRSRERLERLAAVMNDGRPLSQVVKAAPDSGREPGLNAGSPGTPDTPR